MISLCGSLIVQAGFRFFHVAQVDEVDRRTELCYFNYQQDTNGVHHHGCSLFVSSFLLPKYWKS